MTKRNVSRAPTCALKIMVTVTVTVTVTVMVMKYIDGGECQEYAVRSDTALWCLCSCNGLHMHNCTRRHVAYIVVHDLVSMCVRMFECT